jgi:2-polyprenyl-3-methyl-5-hydroxy-6-metoxy-1,4-benzoquinol methylase
VSNRSSSIADSFMIRLFGLSYLRLTRDVLIHERCRYLLRIARQMGRTRLRVLDVGCGSGMALYYLAQFCHDIAGYLGSIWKFRGFTRDGIS